MAPSWESNWKIPVLQVGGFTQMLVLSFFVPKKIEEKMESESVADLFHKYISHL